MALFSVLAWAVTTGADNATVIVVSIITNLAILLFFTF